MLFRILRVLVPFEPITLEGKDRLTRIKDGATSQGFYYETFVDHEFVEYACIMRRRAQRIKSAAVRKFT